jgi:3-oxoacyl-[acyl-carrier-protein] synthase III
MARFARIEGVGSYLPEDCVTNAALADRIETSDEWIRSRTGIAQRYIADPQQLTSDLAVAAARQALTHAGCSVGDIDLIIVATSTPDMVFPSTACIVQGKLGIQRGAAFDVQAVCTGFVYALATAALYIESGQHQRALVIGAEIFSRILDWNDRTTCVLFGDGAGAVVVGASATPGIYGSALHADGRHLDILNVPGHVAHNAIRGQAMLHMDGGAVFKLAVRVLEEVAHEIVNRYLKSLADIDWLIAHQANVRILTHTARKLGLADARVVITVDQHANTSAASIPLALDVAVRDGRIRRGDTVLLEGVGGGFTWGAILLDF